MQARGDSNSVLIIERWVSERIAHSLGAGPEPGSR